MEKLKGLSKSIFYISFPLSFMVFILPIYASNLGASTLEIGLLFSIFSLFNIIARPFVGSWIDKVGRKKGYIIGLICYSLVMVLFLIGNSYKYILAARIVQSIASSFMWISVYTMIADVSNANDRSRNLGHIDQFANKGEMIGATIGFTILFSNFSDEPFKYLFLLYLVVSAIGVFYGLTRANETLAENEKEVIEAIEEEKINGRYIKFLTVMGLMTLVTTMLSPVLLIYLKDHITKDLQLISFLFIPAAILSTFLPKRFGRLADVHGRKKILLIGMIVQAVLVVLISYVKEYYGFMVLYTAFGAAGMLRFPAQTALVTEITGGRKKGKNYGLYCLATGIGGVIGPLLGSGIYQYMSKNTIFYVQGITLIIASVAISKILGSDMIEKNTII